MEENTLPAAFEVKVIGTGHESPRAEHVDWLLSFKTGSDTTQIEPLALQRVAKSYYVGVGVSVRGRSVPDAIVLSHCSRLLVIRFKSIYTKRTASKEMMADVTRFLVDLSKQTISTGSLHGDKDEGKTLHPMLAHVSTEGIAKTAPSYRVVLVCFQGAMLSLLLYRTLQMRFSVIDLSSRWSTTEMSDFQIIETHLGPSVAKQLGRLTFDRLHLQDAALDSKRALRGFLATIRLTISAHCVAMHLCSKEAISSKGSCSELEPFAEYQSNSKSRIVSTKGITVELVDHLSMCAQVHSALHLMGTKKRTANLAMDASGSCIAYTPLEGRSICVTNTDYRTKLSTGSRQGLTLSTLNGRAIRAKTTGCQGRTTTMEIVGNVTNGMSDLQISSVEVKGREDRTSDFTSMMRHWTDLLRVVEVGRDEKCGEILPIQMAKSLSDLCGALLFNCRTSLPSTNLHKFSERGLSNIFGTSASLTAITSDTLNDSQRAAVEAVFAPLPTHDWRQCKHDPRIHLIHGPPGTGKTRVIATICKRFDLMLGSTARSEAIYVACQSNTAVKNVGEALERIGVDFKIFVSPNFFIDWHEDLYETIQGRVLVTDRLETAPLAFREQLGKSNVILMTVAGLSATRYSSTVPLFTSKKMRMLLVDEASQIHLSAYPHVLRRFEKSLSKIVFFGDDKQLAPFGSDDIAQAGQSVFELEHLREQAHFLDTSYRLPHGLCRFISHEVYRGTLRPAETVSCRSLQESVVFVDVERGRHVKGGTTPSLVNKYEAETVVRLVRYLRARKVQFRVLTAYDAQRNEIETRLRKEELSGSGNVVFNIDAFQGQETDIVIASLVRDGTGICQTSSDLNNSQRKQGTVGFLNNQRRTNVLLTRCKRLLIVVSSKRFVTGAANETLIGKLESKARSTTSAGQDIWMSEDDVTNGRFGRLKELLKMQ